MNQASGINLVVYYIPSILVQNAGMSTHTSQIFGGCINMMFMIGSLLPSLALDRMGRRKTMMAGCLGLGVCMLMVSTFLSQIEASNNRGHIFASISVAFFFLYMLVFGMSVNCVPWVYVPEILPLASRTRGAAVGTASNWLWNFTIVMVTPVIINRLQWKAYLIFMVMNFLFIPTVYFFYPETSNLRLEDIDQIFSTRGNPIRIARDMVKSARINGDSAPVPHNISNKLRLEQHEC
jgi:MFS family permease